MKMCPIKRYVWRVILLSVILVLIMTLFSGSLSISASSGTVYESESNNTVSTADLTYDDYDSYGTISSTSDIDWWKVTFTSEGIANFYLGSIPSGCDYQLRVYNYTGNKLLVESLKLSNSSELCKVHVRAGEAYYIKVYSASGYSLTDSYKFRFKRYALNGSRIFTSQHINHMYNKQGSDDWNTVLESMGYDSSVLLNKSADYVYTNMPNYSLTLFNTHGVPGGVCLYISSTSYTSLYGNSYAGMTSNDRAIENYSSSSLSNNVLVLYDSCGSGATSSNYGNLVDKSINKGAFASLGWADSVYTVDANLWGEKFLEYCANGKNVGNAVRLANSWAEDNNLITHYHLLVENQYCGSSRLFAALIG